MKLTLFTFLCLSTSLSAFAEYYTVNTQVKTNEMTLLLGHFKSEIKSSLISEYSPKINKYASTIELVNLQLLIKSEFYKTFLNYFFSSVARQKLLTTRQLKIIKSKLNSNTGATQLTKWLASSLLAEYNSVSQKQKKYISAWLSSYIKLSKEQWNQSLIEAGLTFLNQLSISLELVSKYSVNDRTASNKNLDSKLLKWSTTPLSKSQAIDILDKKSQENMPKSQ